MRTPTGNIDGARFALVMGGSTTSGQSRTTATDKSGLANYLEGQALLAAQSLAAGAVPAQILVPTGTVTAVQGSH